MIPTGRFARRKREEAGLTQAQVALNLGLKSRNSIYGMDTGQVEMKLAYLELLAQVHSTSLAELTEEWEASEEARAIREEAMRIVEGHPDEDLAIYGEPGWREVLDQMYRTLHQRIQKPHGASYGVARMEIARALRRARYKIIKEE